MSPKQILITAVIALAAVAIAVRVKAVSETVFDKKMPTA